ncbi:mitochondrial 37S ribosomal mS37 domain-containing protein [Aspergillus affinis]|uniref:mitochondrial 37S ribosomal mS37 domain-containing protein n=1 Tax=Aspergillus affinis TaxID=1070780 RepID=UPI0022FF15FC|nr:37S ribosomal protein Mrp10 [Aspergillus affinis]KAI9043346.1 37S ribosomal protein Mrp10 [Aspergillus affinis]
MPPKGASTKLNPVRLQTIPHLRIRHPNKNEGNPCMTVMSSMLSCWASSGYTSEGCLALEQQLRQCMDAPVRVLLRIESIYSNPRPIPRALLPKFRSTDEQMLTRSSSDDTEKEELRHKHYQLPPHENVPQGCWTEEEELDVGLSVCKLSKVNNEWDTEGVMVWAMVSGSSQGLIYLLAA